MLHNYVIINCYTDSNKQYYYCMFKPSFRDSYNFNFTLLLENSVLGIVCDISLKLFDKVEINKTQFFHFKFCNYQWSKAFPKDYI